MQFVFFCLVSHLDHRLCFTTVEFRSRNACWLRHIQFAPLARLINIEHLNAFKRERTSLFRPPPPLFLSIRCPRCVQLLSILIKQISNGYRFFLCALIFIVDQIISTKSPTSPSEVIYGHGTDCSCSVWCNSCQIFDIFCTQKFDLEYNLSTDKHITHCSIESIWFIYATLLTPSNISNWKIEKRNQNLEFYAVKQLR